MLPRPMNQRGIFHLGEEGGDGADHDGENVFAGTRHHLGERRPERDHARQRRRGREGAVVDAAGVGLQILVQQQQQHRHHARGTSHIVLKQMVLPTTTAPPPARRRRGPCGGGGGGGFLRACSLCRRELRPDRDVYMYRGDQGFCSEECRRQQILRDETREREAAIKRERMRRGLPHHHHHGPRSAPAPAIRGAARRLVAVAY